MEGAWLCDSCFRLVARSDRDLAEQKYALCGTNVMRPGDLADLPLGARHSLADRRTSSELHESTLSGNYGGISLEWHRRSTTQHVLKP